MSCVVAGASSLARAVLLGICPVQWAHKAQERGRERKGHRKKSGQREEREPFLRGKVLTEKQDF